MTPYYDALRLLVFMTQPKRVLELGTGSGRSGAAILSVLPFESKFTTINLPNPPSGDDVGAELRPWKNDPRLTQILGDSRKYYVEVKPGVDFLFIDSGEQHTFDLISEEWRLYRPLLVTGALVCLDDIHANDMDVFWSRLPYPKIAVDTFSPFGFGVFKYI